jgi:hypothetical protein
MATAGDTAVADPHIARAERHCDRRHARLAVADPASARPGRLVGGGDRAIDPRRL